MLGLTLRISQVNVTMMFTIFDETLTDDCALVRHTENKYPVLRLFFVTGSISLPLRLHLSQGTTRHTDNQHEEAVTRGNKISSVKVPVFLSLVRSLFYY